MTWLFGFWLICSALILIGGNAASYLLTFGYDRRAAIWLAVGAVATAAMFASVYQMVSATANVAHG